MKVTSVGQLKSCWRCRKRRLETLKAQRLVMKVEKEKRTKQSQAYSDVSHNVTLFRTCKICLLQGAEYLSSFGKFLCPPLGHTEVCMALEGMRNKDQHQSPSLTPRNILTSATKEFKSDSSHGTALRYRQS